MINYCVLSCLNILANGMAMKNGAKKEVVDTRQTLGAEIDLVLVSMYLDYLLISSKDGENRIAEGFI